MNQAQAACKIVLGYAFLQIELVQLPLLFMAIDKWMDTAGITAQRWSELKAADTRLTWTA